MIPKNRTFLVLFEKFRLATQLERQRHYIGMIRITLECMRAFLTIHIITYFTG